jgi:hypothetical protein
MIEEGATFVFDSWTCIADVMGGFSHYLAGSAGPLPHPATSFEVPHNLVDKLDNLEIANPNTTQVHTAEFESVSEPSKTHLPGVTIGLHKSNSTKKLLVSTVGSDNTATAQQEAQYEATMTTRYI